MTTEDRRRNGRHGNTNSIVSDGDSDTNTDLDTQLRDNSVKSHDSMESDSGHVKPNEDNGDYEDNKSDEDISRKEDENDEIGNEDKTDNDDGDEDNDGDGSKANGPAEFNIKMEGDDCDIKKEESSEDGNDCKDEKAYQNHMEVENDNGGDFSNPHKKIVDPRKRSNRTTRSKRQSRHSDCKPSDLRWSIRLTEASSHPIAGARSAGTKNRLRQRPTRNTAIESTVIPDSEEDGGSSENTKSDIPERETSSPTTDPEEDESDC